MLSPSSMPCCDSLIQCGLWSCCQISHINYAFHYPVSGSLSCCYVVPEPSVRVRSEGYGSCPCPVCRLHP